MIQGTRTFTYHDGSRIQTERNSNNLGPSITNKQKENFFKGRVAYLEKKLSTNQNIRNKLYRAGEVGFSG